MKAETHVDSEASSGRFLADVRRGRGLTQREVAARCGIAQTNLSRIERDKVSPSVRMLDRILQAMGETLQLSTTSLDQPPPRGGNVTIGELRRVYDTTTPEQRIEQALALGRLAAELAPAGSDGDSER